MTRPDLPWLDPHGRPSPVSRPAAPPRADGLPVGGPPAARPQPSPRPRPRPDGVDRVPAAPGDGRAGDGRAGDGRVGEVPAGSWVGPAAPRVVYTSPDDPAAARTDLAVADEAAEGAADGVGQRGGVLAELPGPDDGGRHRRARREPAPGVAERVGAAVAELRFVRERPSSLVDHVAYARYGDWTTQEDGQRRTAALLWAYVVAVPVTAVAHFVVWAVARPTRAAVVAVLAAVLATALNQIPVVELLVPDGASLTAWPPFSWL